MGDNGVNNWLKKFGSLSHDQHLKNGAQYFNLSKGIPPSNLGIEEQHFVVPGKEEHEGYVYKGYPKDFRENESNLKLLGNDMQHLADHIKEGVGSIGNSGEIKPINMTLKHKIVFDGKNLNLLQNGQTVKTIPATSGIDGETDWTKEDKGPIPPGNYFVNPKEIWNRGLVSGDWGKQRLSIHPFSNPYVLNRDGFFIHGGIKPGSKGCIDLGCREQELFNEIKDISYGIPLEVKY